MPLENPFKLGVPKPKPDTGSDPVDNQQQPKGPSGKKILAGTILDVAEYHLTGVCALNSIGQIRGIPLDQRPGGKRAKKIFDRNDSRFVGADPEDTLTQVLADFALVKLPAVTKK